MSQLKLGSLKIKEGMILAPMAGRNDIAFRRLCVDHGAALVNTGMINSNALLRNNKATLRLAETSEEERPVGIQLFGSNTNKLTEAAQKVEGSCDLVDLNFGCPDRDVIRQGAGPALLRRPTKIGEIVSSVKKAIQVPLTVKIRSGIENHKLENTIKIAKIIEENGADALTIHPRTVKQGYAGKANWKIIKALKDELSIPVIGSGDVKHAFHAKLMKEQTGCDGVMIGRSAIGNPFVFENKQPKFPDLVECYMRYLVYAEEYGLTIKVIKNQCRQFFKEHRNVLEALDNLETVDAIKKFLDSF